MSPSAAPSLWSEFSAASDADWRKVAEEALNGAPFDKKLVTRTPEGIDLQPIYSPSDGERLGAESGWPGLAPYIRGSEPLGARRGGWLICQDPGCTRATEFNAAVREALSRGQNAVNLPLAHGNASRGLVLNTLAEVDAALRGIDLAAVPLFTHAGAAALPFAALLSAWLRPQGKMQALHGAVLADPLSEQLQTGHLSSSLERAYDDMAALTHWAQRDGLRLRTIGVNATLWADAGASAVQELGFALATGIDYLHAMAGRRLHVDVAGPRVLFTFALGSNVFMEIAKLRAARLTWARAIAAADGGAAAQRLECHGRTTRWNKTVLDPHVNLLRTTTEAFAGVVGGCSGLDVAAFDEEFRAPDAFSRRLARNIQIILGEECQFSRVIDPAGGSWYVETLTRQLAAKAWTLFQDIMRKGGMAASIQAGYPQSLVEATAREHLTAVEQRREGIIGTNLHPNLRDTLPPVVSPAATNANDASAAAARARAAFAPLDIHDREGLPQALQEAFHQGISITDAVDALACGSVPPPSVTAVVPRRRAEPFEALRRRAQAHHARTGARPKVFLATMGPRKQHGARADFSASFFATGGFDVTAGKASDTPAQAADAALASGAPVVVICSTDETYPILVPPLARALKATRLPPVVILAGLPATPELQAEFKAAGVDEFIHLRANCAKVLAGIQDRIGLENDTTPRS